MDWLNILVMATMLAAGLILAESANKLERTDFRSSVKPGVSFRDRASTWMRGAAWLMMATGAAGAIGMPFMEMDPHLAKTLRVVGDFGMFGGFALLIVRTRIKETVPGEPAPQSDDFTQTRVFHEGKK